MEHNKNKAAVQQSDDSQNSFKKEEDAAKKGWEKEKDEISGVDKRIEKKLEDGSIQPEDTQNLGD